MNQIVRPANYTSLAAYAKDNPHQTPEVADQVRTSCTSILDYIEDTLRNQAGTSRDTAYDAMKEMVLAFQELQRGSGMAQKQNSEAANRTIEALKAGQEVTLDGGAVKLAGPDQQVTPGEIPTVSAGYRSHKPDLSGWKKARVIQTTVSFSAETPSLGKPKEEYDYSGNSDHSRVQRPAFEGALKKLQEASPLLRALLVNPAVDPSSVGESESHSSLSASSATSHQRSIFHGSTSSSSRVSAQSDSHSQWGPALAEGLGHLDNLREMVSRMHSCPATYVAVHASRTVGANTVFEYTKGIVHKKTLTAEALTRFANDKYDYSCDKTHGNQDRTMGQVEKLPAYIDM